MRQSLWSASGFALVVLVLVSADERVRARFAEMFADPVEGGLTVGGRAFDLLNVVWVSAREQIATNGVFVIFAVVAVVLVLFMVRS